MRPVPILAVLLLASGAAGTWLVAGNRRPPVPLEEAMVSSRPEAPPQDTTVWFHETWAKGDFSYSANGIHWGQINHSGQEPPILVTTVNPAPGRTHSLQFEFTGNANPADDAWSEMRFVLGNHPREMFICWDLYLPGPADGDKGTAPFYQRRDPKGPNNNKLLRLWDDVYEKRHVMAGLSFQPAPTPGDAELTIEYIYDLPNGQLKQVTNFGPWSKIFTDATRGRWNRFGFYARLASAPGINDGAIEVWMNGVRLGQYPNLPFMSGAPDGRNYFGNGYLLGWSNSGYDQTTRLWIGDVRIGRTRMKDC